jgi:hypothetical protein
MATAGKEQRWSVVRDRVCVCGQPACQQALEEQRARREAIIAAQERAFDDTARITGPERPLARDLTEDSSA